MTVLILSFWLTWLFVVRVTIFNGFVSMVDDVSIIDVVVVVAVVVVVVCVSVIVEFISPFCAINSTALCSFG